MATPPPVKQIKIEFDHQSIDQMSAAINELSNQFIKLSLAYNRVTEALFALKTAYPDLFIDTEKDTNA